MLTASTTDLTPVSVLTELALTYLMSYLMSSSVTYDLLRDQIEAVEDVLLNDKFDCTLYPFFFLRLFFFYTLDKDSIPLAFGDGVDSRVYLFINFSFFDGNK